MKSDEGDRAFLLENITGTAIYREIGKAAFLKAKDKKEEIERKKEQIATIQVWSAAEVAEKVTQLNLLKQEVTLLAERIQKDHDKKGLILKFMEIKEAIVQLQAQQLEIAKRKAVFEPYESQLQKHDQLERYFPAILLIDRDRTTLSNLQDEYLNLEREQKALIRALEAGLQEMSGFTQETVDLSNYSKVIRAFESTITELDGKIAAIVVSGKELKSELDLLVQSDDFEINGALRRFDKNNSAQLELVQKRIGELQSNESIQDSDLEIQKLLALKGEKLSN